MFYIKRRIYMHKKICVLVGLYTYKEVIMLCFINMFCDLRFKYTFFIKRVYHCRIKLQKTFSRVKILKTEKIFIQLQCSSFRLLLFLRFTVNRSNSDRIQISYKKIVNLTKKTFIFQKFLPTGGGGLFSKRLY